MANQQVFSAARSLWQRAYVERVIGTIRRECLDHRIVFNERSLCRHLQSFLEYYHRNRVHLALEKDTTEPRPIQKPESGRIVSIPVLGRAASSLRAVRRVSPAFLTMHLSRTSVAQPAIKHPTITKYPAKIQRHGLALGSSGLAPAHPGVESQCEIPGT